MSYVDETLAKIAVKNAGVDHAFALHREEERLRVGQTVDRDREVSLDLFDGNQRQSGGDPADDRHLCVFGGIDHIRLAGKTLFAFFAERIVDNFDGAGLCGVLADIAVLF